MQNGKTSKNKNITMSDNSCIECFCSVATSGDFCLITIVATNIFVLDCVINVFSSLSHFLVESKSPLYFSFYCSNDRHNAYFLFFNSFLFFNIISFSFSSPLLTNSTTYYFFFTMCTVQIRFFFKFLLINIVN